MNKAELVNEVTSKTGLTKKETQNVIGVLTETIGDTLSKGEKVTLVGFGTFQVGDRSKERSESSDRRDYTDTGKESAKVYSRERFKREGEVNKRTIRLDGNKGLTKGIIRRLMRDQGGIHRV